MALAITMIALVVIVRTLAIFLTHYPWSESWDESKKSYK